MPIPLQHIAISDISQVKWSDIGGQSEVKQQLIELVEWPLTRPEVGLVRVLF
jgi:SpoVK/Ycf46/Vps4 family AAA+-type ATPase